MTSLKLCNRCKKQKQYSDFYRDRSKKDGLSTLCKGCKKEQKKLYKATEHFKVLKRESSKRHYEKHRERLLYYRKRYYKEHSDEWAERFKEKYYANKEEYARRAARDREIYRGRHIAAVAKYRALKVAATPAWANLDKIKEIYDKAASMECMEVDHIIPLQSKIVCGLHCENNLQIIPVSQNRKKGNKFEPMIGYNQ